VATRYVDGIGLRPAYDRSRIKAMARFVVDAGAAIRIVGEELEVQTQHELLAPTLLRSHVLSLLHEAVDRGELPADVARERVVGVRQLGIRLLGDAVLQRRAWELADELGWAETYIAEYLALTQLQADAFVTLDEKLARSVAGVVPTSTLDALR
jgi:predicted nucleic acid-binding protein